MILISAIVGKDFKQEIEESELTRDTKSCLNGHKLHLISNLEEYDGHHIIPYHSHIWNYVDKFLYSFIISQKLNEDVLWIDYNKIKKYLFYIDLPKPKNEMLLDDIWWWKKTDNDTHRTESNYLRFSDIILKEWQGWHPIKEYIDKFQLRDDFIVPQEEVFYIPKGISNDKIIRTIEVLKVIVSYASYHQGFPWKTIHGEIGIGNGEGVILPILSQQCGLKLKYHLPVPTLYAPPKFI